MLATTAMTSQLSRDKVRLGVSAPDTMDFILAYDRVMTQRGRRHGH